jgi:pyruvate-ferredoxin/flavodoxin oxidoreductase
MIPGALETVEVTPEIEKRIERARKTCDAEIIR